MYRDCSYVDDQSCCNEILVIKRDYDGRSGVIFPTIFPSGASVVWTLTNAFPSMISFYVSDIWSTFNLPVESEVVKLP